MIQNFSLKSFNQNPASDSYPSKHPRISFSIRWLNIMKENSISTVFIIAIRTGQQTNKSSKKIYQDLRLNSIDRPSHHEPE
jgi:hypothetical protein